MKFVNDAEFRTYGRVLPLDTKEFCEALKKISVPAEGTVYEPSVASFEALPLFKELTDKTYGEMPTELGHCSGHNGSSMPSSITARRKSILRRRTSCSCSAASRTSTPRR